MFDLQDLQQLSDDVNVIPVIDEMPADLFTPLSVYLRLRDDRTASFLLESVEGGESLARYSFIGASPHMMVSGNDRRTMVEDENGETSIEQPILDYLRSALDKGTVATAKGLPTFCGGAVGYIGFPAAAWNEPKLTARFAETTVARFGFFRSFVAFDHAKQTVKIVSVVFKDDHDDASALRSGIDNAVEANRAIREKLETASAVPPRNLDTNVEDEFRSNWNRDGFENAVREIKERIAAGECYQVVISQRFSKRTNAHPVSIYRAIRTLNPSPYMFLLDLGGRAVIGASPEMLVRLNEGRLEYRPIAGTRPRSDDPREDQRLAEEMKRDTKEIAEHEMLVDLGRNDLGRVAVFGTVSVDDHMRVEKYSHVQHLVSSLSAVLRKDCDRFDAFTACFPAGTVSGAPKVKAIEIISELEPDQRDVYSGAIGYFDYRGNMDTCIAIRTLVVENGIATIQAGAGIVADSVPASEYDETINKAKAMMRALEIAEGCGK